MIEVSERTRSGRRAAMRLGDHAAHRDADDVGALDAELVEQAGAVVGHVGQSV